VRIVPQVVAVLLDQVEGVKEYALVSAVVTDEVEREATPLSSRRDAAAWPLAASAQQPAMPVIRV
jgi:hypothetical protein